MNEIWILFFITNLIIPLVMIAIGKLFELKPPKKINHFYGYKTKRSMKNMETWNFAHKYIGKLMFKLGIVLIIFSTIVMFLVFNLSDKEIIYYGILINLLQVLMLIFPIFMTEKALIEKF
jgi:uncharacterized membrane protein